MILILFAPNFYRVSEEKVSLNLFLGLINIKSNYKKLTIYILFIPVYNVNLKEEFSNKDISINNKKSNVYSDDITNEEIFNDFDTNSHNNENLENTKDEVCLNTYDKEKFDNFAENNYNEENLENTKEEIDLDIENKEKFDNFAENNHNEKNLESTKEKVCLDTANKEITNGLFKSDVDINSKKKRKLNIKNWFSKLINKKNIILKRVLNFILEIKIKITQINDNSFFDKYSHIIKKYYYKIKGFNFKYIIKLLNSLHCKGKIIIGSEDPEIMTILMIFFSITVNDKISVTPIYNQNYFKILLKGYFFNIVVFYYIFKIIREVKNVI